MQSQVTSNPSQRMVERHGIDAQRHALDQFVDNSDGTFAVIDAAGNLDGAYYPLGEIAALRGLAAGGPVNGGEIASSVFKDLVERSPDAVGRVLVEMLNLGLRDTYDSLGMKRDENRRDKLFTGYLAHVRIDKRSVSVTTVGDCGVAINGDVIAGKKKEIDRLYAGLIDGTARIRGWDRQKVYESLMPALNLAQFQFQNRPSVSKQETDDFYQWLRAQLQDPDKTGLYYTSALKVLTEALISRTGPLWYPAIDGTYTPAKGIFFRRIRRRDVERVVLWTDGFRPMSRTVNDLDDLEQVLPEHSEATAVVVTGI
jgi:hypothetical protein